jgi:hypothetical protein
MLLAIAGMMLIAASDPPHLSGARSAVARRLRADGNSSRLGHRHEAALKYFLLGAFRVRSFSTASRSRMAQAAPGSIGSAV